MFHSKDVQPVFHLLPLPTMVILVEEEGIRVKDINPAYVDMLDIQENEAKGKLLHTVFDNPRLPSYTPVEASLKKVLKSGTKDKYTEPPVIHHSQNINWLWQIEHVPQKNKDGSLEVVQILQKLKSKKDWQLETSLPNTVGNPFSLWEEGLKISKTGTWELDLSNDSLFWSPAVKEIHGVSITYQPELHSAVHFYKEGISRKVISRALELARENGQPFDVELQIITAKGEHKWIRATGKAVLQNGIVSRIYGAVQDIDDSKRSLMNMLSEKIKYETLIHSINAIIYEANSKDMCLTFVSSQVEYLMGYLPSKLIQGKGFWTDLATSNSPGSLKDAYKKLAEELSTFELKYTIKKSDGEQIPITDRVTVIKKNKQAYYRGLITIGE